MGRVAPVKKLKKKKCPSAFQISQTQEHRKFGENQLLLVFTKFIVCFVGARLITLRLSFVKYIILFNGLDNSIWIIETLFRWSTTDDVEIVICKVHNTVQGTRQFHLNYRYFFFLWSTTDNVEIVICKVKTTVQGTRQFHLNSRDCFNIRGLQYIL